MSARLALNMAEALDRGMFERYREVRMMADLDPLRPMWLDQRDGVREVFNALQKSQPDYAWLGFADVDGTVLASSQGMLEGQSVKERPWFIEGLQAPFAGDVHDAKLLAGLLRPNPGGEPFRFVDVATPVRDARGQLIGVLGGHLSWSWADDLRAALVTPELRTQGTDLWILSATGETLLGPRWGDRPFTAEHIESMRREGNGTFLDESGDPAFSGFAVAKGYRDYPGLGWIVLARQPASIAFAGSRAAAYHLGQRKVVAPNSYPHPRSRPDRPRPDCHDAAKGDWIAGGCAAFGSAAFLAAPRGRGRTESGERRGTGRSREQKAYGGPEQPPTSG